MDMEGRHRPGFFMNFGRPERAWQFTTLANERDRPSLAMPKMQAVVDVCLLLVGAIPDPNRRVTASRNPTPSSTRSARQRGHGWLADPIERRFGNHPNVHRCGIRLTVDRRSVPPLSYPFPHKRGKKAFAALLEVGFDDRILPKHETLSPRTRNVIPTSPGSITWTMRPIPSSSNRKRMPAGAIRPASILKPRGEKRPKTPCGHS